MGVGHRRAGDEHLPAMLVDVAADPYWPLEPHGPADYGGIQGGGQVNNHRWRRRDQTASRHPQLVGLEADGEARVVREAGGGPEFGRSHRRSEARGETGQLDEAVGIVHAGILLRAGVGVVGENFAAPLGRREPASRLRTPAHHALTRRGATDAYKSPTSSDSSPANPAERRVPGQHCLAALVT